MLRPKSLFSFDFEVQASDVPVEFSEMFMAARKALGAEFVKVYAHSVTDHAKRGSSFKRVAEPHPMKVVDIAMVADSCVFRDADISPIEAALVRPVWHVALTEREIRPARGQGRLSWAAARQLIIDPGQCVRVTSSLT